MTLATDMNTMSTELLGVFDERTGDNRLAILKQGDVVWDDIEKEEVIGPDTKYFLTGVSVNSLAGMVNGTTIQQCDMMITASTDVFDELGVKVDYAPQVRDKMLIDGAQWSIVDAPHVNYTGNALTVVYKMQVRK